MTPMRIPGLAATLAIALAGALIGTFSAAPVWAADTKMYPDRPITIIVPFPPGGLTDIVARQLARAMQETFKQTVVVDNKAGASGQIGSQHVARAAGDGYTLLVTATHFVVNPAVRKTLPYDPVKDFTPIALLVSTPNVLAVTKSLPVNTLQEYLAYARQQKDGLAFASSGIGGSTHLSGEMLKVMAKAPLMHVPYKGMVPAINDTLGGQVPSIFADIGGIMPFAKDGKIRIIGVTSPQRSPALPDVPTIAEQGVPGYEANTFIGLMGPADMPPAVVEKLNRLARDAMHASSVAQTLEQNGGVAGEMSAAQYGEYVRSELVKWKRVAQEANVPVEE